MESKNLIRICAEFSHVLHENKLLTPLGFEAKKMMKLKNIYFQKMVPLQSKLHL